jgi:hypothetical protein
MIDITDQKALDAALEEFRKSWDDQERKEFEKATSVESTKPTRNLVVERRIHRLLMENEKRCDEKRTWDSAVGVMVKSEED